MPTVNRSALVMHSAEQMYQLINNVLAYPLFLADCADSKIISQTDTEMQASLLVSKGGLTKWFSTKNTLLANQRIGIELVDGPFRYLTGQWLLTPLSEDACKVELTLDYEFSNKVLALAFGRVFNHLANSMVQAFIARAKEVYQ